jgi:hypothetical protein
MAVKLALFSLFAAGSSAMELTNDNWDAVTGGKQVFVKFLAPW